MSTYTVGLIGAGGIANAHLPALLALGIDVVVFSLDGQAPALVERHGGGRVADSLDVVLSQVDAVDVCTPTFTHREIVLQAAAAGRDIVCEKPLALTTEAASEMIDACAEAGVQLYPAHVVRFFPEYRAMQQAVAEGAVGDVAVQRFTRLGSRPLGSWFADVSLSGGIAMDQMIHDFDFARWTAGEVVSVRAVQASTGDPLDTSTVISVHAQLTHTSGAISFVSGTWAAQGSAFETSFEVAGSDGLLQHDSRNNPALRLNTGAEDPVGGLLPETSFTESPYQSELREFLAAFASGSIPRVSAEDGVAAIAIASAVNESLASGEAVPVPTSPSPERAVGAALIGEQL